MARDLCARKFKHIWPKEAVMVTKTHELKKCERCKGKKWVERKDEGLKTAHNDRR